MNWVCALVIMAVLGIVVAYPTNELQGTNEDDSNILNAASWDAAVTPRLTIVSKAQWGGRAATSTSRLATPVPNVIIHHTVTAFCSTRDACSRIMRSMQDYHMNGRGYADIGYNFAVGGDGAVYQGRGWNFVGAHVSGSNVNSIGIAFIGTFTSTTPTAAAINAARSLITGGMNTGFISRNHRLLGHKDAPSASTDCPGAALLRTIQSWPNWSNAEVDFDDQL